MISNKYRYKPWFKAIAIGVVCLFTFNSISWALAPTNRFNPNVVPVWNGKSYDVRQDEEAIAEMLDGFKEDSVFIYLCRMISRFLIGLPKLKGYGMTETGIEDLFRDTINEYYEKNYPALTDEQKAIRDELKERFSWNGLYLDGDVICLPYMRKDDPKAPPQILKFYLADEKIRKSQAKLADLPITGFADKIDRAQIPTDIEGLRVILEDPEKKDYEARDSDDKGMSGTRKISLSELKRMVAKQKAGRTTSAPRGAENDTLIKGKKMALRPGRVKKPMSSDTTREDIDIIRTINLEEPIEDKKDAETIAWIMFFLRTCCVFPPLKAVTIASIKHDRTAYFIVDSEETPVVMWKRDELFIHPQYFKKIPKNKFYLKPVGTAALRFEGLSKQEIREEVDSTIARLKKGISTFPEISKEQKGRINQEGLAMTERALRSTDAAESIKTMLGKESVLDVGCTWQISRSVQKGYGEAPVIEPIFILKRVGKNRALAYYKNGRLIESDKNGTPQCNPTNVKVKGEGRLPDDYFMVLTHEETNGTELSLREFLKKEGINPEDMKDARGRNRYAIERNFFIQISDDGNPVLFPNLAREFSIIIDSDQKEIKANMVTMDWKQQSAHGATIMWCHFHPSNDIEGTHMSYQDILTTLEMRLTAPIEERQKYPLAALQMNYQGKGTLFIFRKDLNVRQAYKELADILLFAHVGGNVLKVEQKADIYFDIYNVEIIGNSLHIEKNGDNTHPQATSHAPGHVATFFKLLYGLTGKVGFEQGKEHTIEELCAEVLVKGTPLSSDKDSRAMRDLSMLVRSGLADAADTGKYVSRLTDEEKIHAVHDGLTDLKAHASFKEVQGVREREIAIDFRNAAITKAVKAKDRGEYIYLGLEETWIKNKSGPQPLISEFERLPENLRQRGLDNVIFGRGKGDAFAGVIAGKQERLGSKLPLSNIVVLGSQSILKSKAYNALRSDVLQESAFLLGVDNSHLGFESATRLLEMYLLGLKLNSVKLPKRSDPKYKEKVKKIYDALLKTLDQKFIKIGFAFNGKFWDFVLTPIEPFNVNEFRDAIEIQAREIDSKA